MGFRYFAIRAARRAGVEGTVRNLADGTVEAIAEGPVESITEFRKELERGPSHGHVEQVVEVEIALSGRYAGFDVVY